MHAPHQLSLCLRVFVVNQMPPYSQVTLVSPLGLQVLRVRVAITVPLS